jgi:predicted Zn-dependent protease with MMP-like domain
MERDEFEKYVSEGVELLPKWVRNKIKNVALLVEDAPSLTQRKKQNLRPDQTLLGLYQGIPLTERGAYYGTGMTLPDTITIFKEPIENIAGNDPERIRRIVADTVWHEFAHHFGMNESMVRNKEKKRNKKGS